MPKIVNQLRKTAWQLNKRRVALIQTRRATENALMAYMANVNLDMAIDTFATADDFTMSMAERNLTLATICELLTRERHTGISNDMLCGCGSIKSRGHNCDLCQRYRDAMYGGTEWVLFGSC